MPKKHDTATLNAMRDLDEEDEDTGLDETRSYLFNIGVSVAVRAESLDEAEEILEEDDYYNSPNIRILDIDTDYIGEE